MSQSGALVFYCDNQVANPQEAFTQLMRLTGATRISFAARMTYAAARGESENEVSGQLSYVGEGIEIVARSVSIDDPSIMFDQSSVLSIELGETPLGNRVMSAVQRELPSSIRGDFAPTDAIVKIGWHPVCTGNDEESHHALPEAFISFALFGYNTPNNWKRTRQMLFELHEIQVLRRQIEAIIGPVHQDVCWTY